MALTLGVALLVVGLRLRNDVGTICGVLGFVAVVAGTDFAFRVSARLRADRTVSGRSARRWRR